MTPMGRNESAIFPKSLYTLALGHSVFFYLAFLIFNTSFTIMGVDVGDFLKQYLGSFFGVYLHASILIFAISYYTTLSLYSIFYTYLRIGYDREPKSGSLFFCVFGFQVLLLAQSMIVHPQIYGEFFFYRYPSSAGVLYFLTDFIPPKVLSFLSHGILLIGLFISIWYLYKNKTKQAFAYLCHLLILGVLHGQGSLILGLLYFIFVYWQGPNFERIHIKTYVRLIFLIIFLYIFPSLLNTFSGFFASKDADKPPIYIISADSLRFDRIGKQVHGKSITPHIDTFQKDSFNFLDHHTTIPRTFPSWTDFLTGQYSMSHKIRDMFPSVDEIQRIGSDSFPTLLQVLGKIGYKNYAVSSFAGDIFPRANFGFDQVFAPNFNAKLMTIQRTAETQLLILPILTGELFDRGYFLPELFGLSTWGDGKRLVQKFKEIVDYSGSSSHSITYFSSVIHFPYSPPYPYYKEYTDSSYYGKYKYLKFVDPTKSDALNEQEIQQVRNLFDGSVRAFDDEFGEIVTHLKSKGFYDSSIIILTADHGESLYEDVHGQGHGEHLRGESVTKVPLLIKFPKQKMSEYKETDLNFFGVTSSVDIYPTLLEYLKIQNSRDMPGESLIQVLGKKDWDKERFIYAETGIWFSDVGGHFFQSQRIPYPNILSLHQVVPEEDYQIMITDIMYRDTIAFSKHRSIQTSEYKLIYIPTRSGVLFELYNRKLDPNNTKNLFPSGPVGQKLKDKLYELVTKWESANRVGEFLIPESIYNLSNQNETKK